MARKRRNGKSKSEKETEPKEEAGFLGELLSLICRAPFPFSAVGLVLKRLPPPWNKRALAIVLIAVGILIVHPLVPPVWDFSLWLYYRVVPGPPVLVDFNNVTGESASIGKEFKFWISENQRGLNTIHNIRAMPDGAITISAYTKETVLIHLGRDPKIRRFYKGGGYLRLCFVVNEEEKEVEDDCSNMISKRFSLLIFDPEQWTSRAIALWFSPMGARADPNRYIPEHSEWAIEAIAEKLGAFRVAVDDSLRQENSAQVFVKVTVGCYKTDEPDESELKVSIQNDKIKEKERDLPTEQYKTAGDIHDIKRALRGRAERIVPRIHKRTLNAYPLRGYIEEVEEVEGTSHTQVILNIGRDAGVLKDDKFKVLGPSDDTDPIAYVTVKETEPMYSFAESSDQDGERIKKKCRVKKHVPRKE